MVFYGGSQPPLSLCSNKSNEDKLYITIKIASGSKEHYKSIVRKTSYIDIKQSWQQMKLSANICVCR